MYIIIIAATSPHTTTNNIVPASILFAIVLVAIARIACLAETAATSTDGATLTIDNWQYHYKSHSNSKYNSP